MVTPLHRDVALCGDLRELSSEPIGARCNGTRLDDG